MSNHIFVYGTLKSSQHRARQWPISPLHIQPAWTLGRLYDTGPYPAMLTGKDRIAGELWTFRDEDLPTTFEVLDEIEGTNQPGQPNDYDRVVQEVVLRSDHKVVQASTYQFALLDLVPTFEYLPPALAHDGELYSVWPKDAKWEIALS